MSLPKFTPEERAAIEKVLAETPFVTEGEPFDLAAALFVAGRNFAAPSPQAVVVPSTDAFKEAYMEWSRKTDWVLEQQDSFPFRTLGIHRADVMRQEIERLRAALASSPVAQQQGWISIKDRAPPMCEVVLVALSTGAVVSGQRYALGETVTWVWDDTDDEADSDATATHWMKFPAAPSTASQSNMEKP